MRVGGELRRLQCAPQSGERRAEKERAREQQRLVDAERRHHLAILGRGPHQHAVARLVHQQPQEAQHQRPHCDQKQLVARKSVAEDIDGAGETGRARPQDVERAPDLDHHVLHDQHHAEGGEQLEQLRHAIDAAQQDELHHHTDHPDRDGRQQHTEEEHRQAGIEIEQAGNDGDAEIGPQHVEGAVGEIDDPRDAEDDRQAGGNDEQRGGAGQPVERLHEKKGKIGHPMPRWRSRIRFAVIPEPSGDSRVSGTPGPHSGPLIVPGSRLCADSAHRPG